jgi:hypothetical protein
MSDPRQYSPDGKWWWDGQQWQPVEPGPAQPPQQPPRSKRRRWPWFAAGAVVLVVLFSVCIAAIANSSGGQQKAASTATPAAQAATAKTATAAPAAAPSKNGSCAPQPCANDNFGWIVTVSDVKYNAPSGNDFEKPEAGNVYVTMNVTFTNQLKSEQHANPTEFVLLDGSGIKHTETFMTACPFWEPVNVTSGATFGPKCLVFEAAAGKPQGLTLVWTPSFIGGGYNIKLS